MDTNSLDYNTVTLMVMIAGSWLTLVGLIIYQSNRLDNKFDTKIDALDKKFDNKIDALDKKFDNKIDALDKKFDNKIDGLGDNVTSIGERVARIEGHLMGPESFSPRALPPPTDEPGDGEREAG
ncbi:MAG: hypothetical protein OXC06_07560 [Acidimicrobiaceae bacterium]|nr:hypothetical protein [Acidimicrobiaceae bacterium]